MTSLPESPVATTATAYFYNGTTDGAAPSITFNVTSNLLPPRPKTVKVYDLRHASPQHTLDKTRCELVTGSSSTMLREFEPKSSPEDLWRDAYYEECQRLVKSRMGCSRALAFAHRHREQVAGLHDEQGFGTKPVATFHIDNDASTAEQHLRRELGNDEAEREWLGSNGRRWGIVNVWRPVGETVEQLPLALALWNHQSAAAAAAGQQEYGVGDNGGIDETVQIATPSHYKTHFIGVPPLSEPRYKFWYASRITPDEALVFMDYDSKAGAVSGVAHGAVEDHASPEDAPLRRSIEVRVLVLF